MVPGDVLRGRLVAVGVNGYADAELPDDMGGRRRRRHLTLHPSDQCHREWQRESPDRWTSKRVTQRTTTR